MVFYLVPRLRPWEVYKQIKEDFLVTRKPNFAKFILGGVVLALLFIGTLATVRTPRTSAAKGTITTNMLGVAVGMPSPVPTPTPPPVPVHVGNVFQIDGNAADGTPSTGTDDWNDYDPPISTVSDASSGSVTGPFGHSVIATFVSDPSI